MITAYRATWSLDGERESSKSERFGIESRRAWVAGLKTGPTRAFQSSPDSHSHSCAGCGFHLSSTPDFTDAGAAYGRSRAGRDLRRASRVVFCRVHRHLARQWREIAQGVGESAEGSGKTENKHCRDGVV